MTYGNLLRDLYPYSQTGSNEISYEIDRENGTITFNGTYTASPQYNLWLSQDFIGARFLFPFDVKLYGAPNGSSTSTYCYGGTNIGVAGNGTLIPANTQFSLAIVIKKNVVCNNLVFRPIIAPAYTNSDSYNPYAMNLQEITKFIPILKYVQNITIDQYSMSTNNIPIREYELHPLIGSDGSPNIECAHLIKIRRPYTTVTGGMWINFTGFIAEPASTNMGLDYICITRYGLYNLHIRAYPKGEEIGVRINATAHNIDGFSDNIEETDDGSINWFDAVIVDEVNRVVSFKYHVITTNFLLFGTGYMNSLYHLKVSITGEPIAVISNE